MSTWVHEEIPCHGCGHRFMGRTVNGLNITRSPDIVEAILSGQFHNFTCPECERKILVEKPFLYTDLESFHFMSIQPRAQIDSWHQAERDIRDLYLKYIVEEPTQQLFTEDDHARFKVRALFGYERLREKLLLWKHDLDDRLMEVAKLHLLAKHPYLAPHGYIDLIATEVSPERDELTFRAIPPRAQDPLVVKGTLTIYRELEAARATVAQEHEALFDNAFVDYRRYAYDA